VSIRANLPYTTLFRSIASHGTAQQNSACHRSDALFAAISNRTLKKMMQKNTIQNGWSRFLGIVTLIAMAFSARAAGPVDYAVKRSEEHTSEIQLLRHI